jgi:hypothetical protein
VGDDTQLGLGVEHCQLIDANADGAHVPLGCFQQGGGSLGVGHHCTTEWTMLPQATMAQTKRAKASEIPLMILTDALLPELKLPHKDPARRRAYHREYQAKLRRERGMMAKDDPTSIENQRPWEQYRVSRAFWFLRYGWTPAERERWWHREQS